MTISGGGSRSAYYAARVMDELSQIPLPGVVNQPGPNGCALYSMLDSVRVMSTVSAGGLAASYYVTNFDYRHQPGFFEKFASTMAVNLQWATYGHMAMFPPLAIQLLASNVTRTDLLADQIDKLLGKQKLTFNDLRRNELRPIDPTPTLLINGTIYNSGQRLVMTNLPGERFPSLLDNEGPRVTMPEIDRQTLSNLVQPLTFADFGSDIGPFRLSQALAASAAYPIVLAPVPLRVYPNNVPQDLLGRVDQKLLQSKIAYVADGGLYENEGVDPLLSMVKTLPRKLPILLIIVDGSQRMETMSLKEGKVWGPISVISRMYDIGTLKPLAYYRSMLASYHDEDKIEAVFIRMEGYDANSQQKLRDIPTTFKLSDDHVAVLDQAARQNVARMAPALLGAFERLSAHKTHKGTRASRR
jgi:predicted acylesterase/phospholipase RssA